MEVAIMKYETLRKLYYSSKEEYLSEYQNRINLNSTIKFDFNIGENQAFFVQTQEVIDLLSKILRLDKKILSIKSGLPKIAIRQFSNRCLIDEIILTNRIEGVQSTRKEISEVLDDLEEKITLNNKKKRFNGMILRYLRLSNNIDLILDTCTDMRKLYDEIVLQEVIDEEPKHYPDGELFRKELSSVHTVTGKIIHNGVYPEEKIKESIMKAITFLKDDSIESLYRISIFHYLIEYIHPFYDGNGRLGRYILSDFLSKELDPLIAYRISYTILDNIKEYYQAFEECNDSHNLGDVTPFLIMMLTMIHTSMARLSGALESRKIKFDRYKKVIAILPCRPQRNADEFYYLLLQASLFSEKGITTKELEKYLKSSYGTIKKDIDFLKEKGLLITQNEGRKLFYQFDLKKFDNIYLSEKE